MNRRRVSWTIRAVAIVVVVVGPIAGAAFEVYARDSDAYVRVTPTVAGEFEETTPADRVATYLGTRNPLVDSVLPEGAGGTSFFASLDTNAGMAFVASAEIGLAATDALLDGGGEVTEVHERAHLAHAAMPQLVARLITRLSPPAGDEYAAKNHREHFAEMAAQAYEVLIPPTNTCLIGTAAERLRAVELRVPGTAGFVVWFLNQPAMAGAIERDSLLAEANHLVAPTRPEWEPIWRAIDARRIAGDSTASAFTPWPRLTVRQVLESRRGDGASAGGWLSRVDGIVSWPSLALVRLVQGG